jgi:hypothetical protein
MSSAKTQRRGTQILTSRIDPTAFSTVHRPHSFSSSFLSHPGVLSALLCVFALDIRQRHHERDSLDWGLGGADGLSALCRLEERRQMEKDMNLATDEVGKEDLFARFNVGWVLPEGSKPNRPRPPGGEPVAQT